MLTLNVKAGHIIAIGGSGGMDVTETAGVTGGNQYTTAAGSVNMLDLVGLGMNSIDSEGTRHHHRGGRQRDRRDQRQADRHRRGR